jgi:regulatory protein YycH of two-component signal transduction system YycFG
MLDYCRELFRLENKQNNLEDEAKERGIAVPMLLKAEKKILAERAEKMSQNYSQLIFQFRTISDQEMESCHSAL